MAREKIGFSWHYRHFISIPAAILACLVSFVLSSPRVSTAEVAANALDIKKYYAMSDLNLAAELLRADSARLNIDILAQSRAIAHVFDLSDAVSVKLPVVTFTPDDDQASYQKVLEQDAASGFGGRERTVVLLISRRMSIDEIAELFEGGVRIYEGLVGGYIIRAKSSDLAALMGRDYYLWMGDYGPSLKQNPESQRSVNAEFMIWCFYETIEEGFLVDVEGLGGEIISQNETFGILVVEASPEQISRIKSLLWVRLVQAVVDGAPDGVDDQLSVESAGGPISTRVRAR